MTFKEPPMPEHDKFLPHKEDAQTIGEFIEWLPSVGLHLAEYPEEDADGYLWQSRKTIQDIIAEYFGIDKKAFDAETEALYQVVSEAANHART
jgi:hypothetical protein